LLLFPDLLVSGGSLEKWLDLFQDIIVGFKSCFGGFVELDSSGYWQIGTEQLGHLRGGVMVP
jgi:hypothetical protein